MRATLSLAGMYNFDPTIFDMFLVPPGVDKNMVIDHILIETADMEVLFTQPSYLKNAIGVWSRMWLPIWAHLWETTQYEYNPIDNYDRTETRSWTEGRENKDTLSRNDTENIDKSNNYTRDLTDVGTTSKEGGSTSQTTASTIDNTTQDEARTTDKAAYNSSSYEPVDKVTNKMTQDHTNSANGNVTNSENERVSESVSRTGRETDTDEIGRTLDIDETKAGTENIEHTETVTAKGNIGVTTTQQMIQSEREIAMFNVAKIICDAFIEKFCILVY